LGTSCGEKPVSPRSGKTDYHWKKCRKRAERFPTDLGIRFELAQIYFKLGISVKPSRSFKKARLNPHKKIPSMNYLASATQPQRMFELAARTLERPLRRNSFSTKKKEELVYNFRWVLEAAWAKREEALNNLDGNLTRWDSVQRRPSPRVTHIIPGAIRKEQFGVPFVANPSHLSISPQTRNCASDSSATAFPWNALNALKCSLSHVLPRSGVISPNRHKPDKFALWAWVSFPAVLPSFFTRLGYIEDVVDHLEAEPKRDSRKSVSALSPGGGAVCAHGAQANAQAEPTPRSLRS